MTIAILLLALGLVLIVLELLFPTLGALGITAALCIIGAVAVAFAHETRAGVWMLVASALSVPTAILVGLKLMTKSPARKVLVTPGYTFQDGAAVDVRDRSLAGKEGLAENLLRPSGTAMIDGRRVDVVTRGEPIEAGAKVKVLEVEGNRVVVVRALDPGH